MYEVTAADPVAETTVTAMPNHIGASVVIESEDGLTSGPTRDVALSDGKNTITVTVTAADGLTTRAYTVTVTREYTLEAATITADTSPASEGADVVFTVHLNKEAKDALTVSVSVAETGSMLSGAITPSVTVGVGETRATLSVPTAGDAVIEAGSTVTAFIAAGAGYVLGTGSSASVTVEDDDEAVFAVSAAPAALSEGESATLTAAISNGVTFAQDQTIALAVSGTASAADYSLTPGALTLAAAASSATATLGALPDQEEEADETVTVTASHGGVAIGSATVAIESVSHDATLSALGLSGIDIGAFASGTTAYTASVPNATTSTTVTAAASHAGATVAVSPGAEMSLAEETNEITITVTAEDSTTTRTYTVTVTRDARREATIAAVASAVTEGAVAEFEVRLDQAAAKALTVAVRVTETGSMLSGVSPAAVAFSAGDTRATLSVPTVGDSVVEADSTVTATVTSGPGYSVGSTASASVTVEDENDGVCAIFCVNGCSEGHQVTPCSLSENRM